MKTHDVSANKTKIDLLALLEIAQFAVQSANAEVLRNSNILFQNPADYMAAGRISYVSATLLRATETAAAIQRITLERPSVEFYNYPKSLK